MIASLKNSDHSAFTEIYNLYHKKVHYFVLSKTDSPYLAEEATQLAFIKLWQYRSSLDETIPLEAHIFRIVKTTLIDLLRKDSVRAKCLKEKRAQNPPTLPPDAVLQHKELALRLERVINDMPPMRRQVFRLSRNQGLTYAEISSRLSISVKTVEHHIALAIKELRILFLFLILIVHHLI